MPELPRRPYMGQPDCGLDHGHDEDCFPGLRAVAAVVAATAILDALADLSELAAEHGHKIVLDPRGGGEWIAFLGPTHVDYPYSFATGDLPTALEHLRDVVRKHG